MNRPGGLLGDRNCERDAGQFERAEKNNGFVADFD
jgi:hypothetical protein